MRYIANCPTQAKMLRAHIYRSLLQVAKIADMEIPGISDGMRYDGQWQLEAYQAPNRQLSD